MDDLISRADAIGAVRGLSVLVDDEDFYYFEDALKALPSADADGEDLIIKGAKGIQDGLYNIKDGKLFKYKGKGGTVRTYPIVPSADATWVPCSERLPKAEDMYQPPEQRYLCQLEAHGERKFCVLSRLKGAVSPFWDWYGIAVYDSEVTAWMPLPKPYKGGDDE